VQPTCTMHVNCQMQCALHSQQYYLSKLCGKSSGRVRSCCWLLSESLSKSVAHAERFVRKVRQRVCSAGRLANTSSRVGDSSGVLMSDTSRQLREVNRLTHACKMNMGKIKHSWCNADHSHSRTKSISKLVARVSEGRPYQGLNAHVVSTSTVCHNAQLLQLSCCRCCMQQRMFHHVGVEASHLHVTIQRL
jgi:hypothetical protein